MRTKLLTIASLIIIASMALAACQPAAATPQVVEKTVMVAGTPQTVVVTATPEPSKAATFNSKDPTTMTWYTFGEPETLDVALDYETAGAGVLQNVYETLLFYKRESVTELIPQLATEVPTAENGGISADGLTYTFKIRKGVKFHDGTEMTPEDVAYSIQRDLLQGGSGSPQWLLAEPLLGSTVNNDITDQVDETGALVDDPANLVKAPADKLKAACQKVTDAVAFDNAAGTVTFKLAQSWGPFLVTMAGPYASIQSKKWDIANGAWDGSCDTWQNFYGKSSEELNKGKLGTGENGTGPYILDHWTPKEEIVLKAFDGYWRTEPAWEGGPTGAPALKTVIIKSVDEFSTRLAAFQAGDADFITLGSTSDWPQMDTLTGEVCDVSQGQDPTKGDCTPGVNPSSSIRVFRKLTQITRTDAYFNFNLNTQGGNNFIGSGKIDGDGITPDFFSDIHIRKAFNYCFDWDTFIKQVQQGEGVQATDVMLHGEVGDDPNGPHYTYDTAKCEEEFKASQWKSADGKQLWDVGFRMTIAYNTGNTQRQTIAQIFQNDISAINDKFVIEVTALPWPTFLQNNKAKKLPFFIVGWQEDIPDPHNWVFTYTLGYTGSLTQNMPADLKAQFKPLVEQGVHETDPAKRAEIYKQFNQLYYDNAPSVLLSQAFGRHYEQRWVKGYYNNPIYGEFYWYSLSKQ